MAVLASLHRSASSHRSQTLVVPSLPWKMLFKTHLFHIHFDLCRRKAIQRESWARQSRLLETDFLQHRNEWFCHSQDTESRIQTVVFKKTWIYLFIAWESSAAAKGAGAIPEISRTIAAGKWSLKSHQEAFSLSISHLYLCVCMHVHWVCKIQQSYTWKMLKIGRGKFSNKYSVTLLNTCWRFPWPQGSCLLFNSLVVWSIKVRVQLLACVPFVCASNLGWWKG